MATLIVGAILAVIIGVIIRSMINDKKNGVSCSGCSGNCGGCGGHSRNTDHEDHCSHCETEEN